jgi:hypothetical protein
MYAILMLAGILALNRVLAVSNLSNRHTRKPVNFQYPLF